MVVPFFTGRLTWQAFCWHEDKHDWPACGFDDDFKTVIPSSKLPNSVQN
jgi:hypothetical protein